MEADQTVNEGNDEHGYEVLIACHECDLLQTRVLLQAGQKMTCQRCGAVLDRKSPSDLDHLLAYAIAAAICLSMANFFPIMSLEAMGLKSHTTLVEAAIAMYRQGMAVVSVLILFTALIAPALMLFAMLYMLVPLKLNKAPKGFALLLRLFQKASPWAMIEVLMLGILVSFVKLSDLATAEVNLGLWAFAATMIFLALLSSNLSEHDLWRQYERLHGNRLAFAADACADGIQAEQA